MARMQTQNHGSEIRYQFDFAVPQAAFYHVAMIGHDDVIAGSQQGRNTIPDVLPYVPTNSDDMRFSLAPTTQHYGTYWRLGPDRVISIYKI